MKRKSMGVIMDAVTTKIKKIYLFKSYWKFLVFSISYEISESKFCYEIFDRFYNIHVVIHFHIEEKKLFQLRAISY